MSIFQDQNGKNAIFPMIFIIHSNVSMGGAPIKNINENLASFFESLSQYTLTHGRVETAVITVTDQTKLIQDWQIINSEPVKLPSVFANGAENLNNAFSLSLKMIEDKCAAYDAADIKHHTPAIVLISDDVSFSDDALESAIKEKVEKDELTLFLLFVNNDEAPEICADKNAYTIDSDDPYNFSGFFKLVENAVKSTAPFSADQKIDYTDLLNELWERLPLKKIFKNQ